MEYSAEDFFYMSYALELAAQGQGRVEPNPMVGCVIVRPSHLEEAAQVKTTHSTRWTKKQEEFFLSKILGAGFHQQYGQAHAEIMAFYEVQCQAENASSQKSCDDSCDATQVKSETIRWDDVRKWTQGATLYVTLEPCCHYGKTPPCVEAILKSGVKKVVMAMRDPHPNVNGGGLEQLQNAGIEVVTGVLEDEARFLNAPYLTRLSKNRPWMIGKWAMTLDGKMATRTGSSYWISSEESRRQVHRLRSRMDAIMIGSRTAMEDDPKLTVRLPEGESPLRTPVRVVFDSGGTLSVFSELALTAKEVPLLLVFGPETPKDKVTFWEQKYAEVLVLDAKTHEQRLVLLLENLAQRGMTNVLVEGGGKLLGHLFDLECLDEVKVFVAPKIVGGENAIVPVGGFGCEHMKMATKIVNQRVEMFGNDVMIAGRLDYRS